MASDVDDSRVRILLDCGLGQARDSKPSAPTRTMNYMRDVDWKGIDVILVSHFSRLSGLAFITEYSAFNGKVFATDRESLSETEPNRLAIHGQVRPWFTLSDIQHCISRIQRVRFNETVTIGPDISIMAVSAGGSLGSSNWVITCGLEKIMYLSPSTTSTLNHAAKMNQDYLPFMDHVICGLAYLPRRIESYIPTLKKLFPKMGRLLEKGESVVCLCQPFEMLYEIIEIVNHWINTLGVTRPTLHVVSPVAFESLNLCSMFGEWMSPERQGHVFESQTPLAHGALLESKQLQIHRNMNHFLQEISGPFVAFICTSFDGVTKEQVLQLQSLLSRSPKFFITDPAVSITQLSANIPAESISDFRTSLVMSASELKVILENASPDTVVVPSHSPDIIPNAIVAKQGSALALMEMRRFTECYIVREMVNKPLKTTPVQGIISLQDKTVRRDEAGHRVLFIPTSSTKDMVKCLCMDGLRGTMKSEDDDSFLIELDEGYVEYSKGSILVGGTDVSQIASVTEWIIQKLS